MIYLSLLLAVAALIATAYFWGHSSGKKDLQNAVLQKDVSTKEKQAEIAAGVPDSPDAVDDWLSKPSSK